MEELGEEVARLREVEEAGQARPAELQVLSPHFEAINSPAKGS